jgi:hypothetical protein
LLVDHVSHCRLTSSTVAQLYPATMPRAALGPTFVAPRGANPDRCVRLHGADRMLWRSIDISHYSEDRHAARCRSSGNSASTSRQPHDMPPDLSDGSHAVRTGCYSGSPAARRWRR